MSHFSVLKVGIKNIQLPLLKQTLQNMGFNNIRENDYVYTYYGDKTKCDLVIDVGNGKNVGLRVNYGKLEIISDNYYSDNYKVVRRLNDELNQYYTATAFQISLRKMGYKVTVSSKDEKILVSAF